MCQISGSMIFVWHQRGKTIHQISRREPLGARLTRSLHWRGRRDRTAPLIFSISGGSTSPASPENLRRIGAGRLPSILTTQLDLLTAGGLSSLQVSQARLRVVS